jgi:hypothetical protein
MLDLWDAIGVHGHIPQNWEITKGHWMPKPGKNPTFLDNRRGIMNSEPMAKAYFSELQLALRNDLKTTWTGQEYGGLESRSTTHPIAIVDETANRFRKAGVSFYNYVGDGIKAYDHISRIKVCRAVRKLTMKEASQNKFQSTETSRRVIQAHKRTMVITKQGKSRSMMRTIEGVTQGNPLGPICFNAGYHEFGMEVEEKRADDKVHKMDVSYQDIAHNVGEHVLCRRPLGTKHH